MVGRLQLLQLLLRLQGGRASGNRLLLQLVGLAEVVVVVVGHDGLQVVQVGRRRRRVGPRIGHRGGAGLVRGAEGIRDLQSMTSAVDDPGLHVPRRRVRVSIGSGRGRRTLEQRFVGRGQKFHQSSVVVGDRPGVREGHWPDLMEFLM